LEMVGVSRERGGASDVCGSDVVDGGTGIWAIFVEGTKAGRVGNVWVVAAGRGTVVGVISGVLLRPAFCFHT
jgi:hypothetical protein